jgi:SAM-dependent methyltransferase
VRKFAGFFYRALFQPAPCPCPPRPWRNFLRLPIVFDLVSLILQLQQLRRLSHINDEYVVTDELHRASHDYNAGMTKSKRITTTRRAEEFYNILTSSPRDLRNEKLLIVGPRNVLEIYLAWLHGYRWKNISAIDLYSMHEKIQPMNMEDMTFEDETFDAVTMSATLAYAKDTHRALSEVSRVLKKGGRAVLGATYDPGGGWIGATVRAEEIVTMCRDVGLDIFFYTYEDKINSEKRIQTAHRLGLQKNPPRSERNDPVILG